VIQSSNPVPYHFVSVHDKSSNAHFSRDMKYAIFYLASKPFTMTLLSLLSVLLLSGETGGLVGHGQAPPLASVARSSPPPSFADVWSSPSSPLSADQSSLSSPPSVTSSLVPFEDTIPPLLSRPLPPVSGAGGGPSGSRAALHCTGTDRHCAVLFARVSSRGTLLTTLCCAQETEVFPVMTEVVT